MKEQILQEELQRSIDRVTGSEVRAWAVIGHLLDQVDVTGFWQEHASSFSEWLRSFASSLGLGEASLWRYLASARYYKKLQETLSGRGVPCPQLNDLPGSVSPENLELLAKLARVAPDKVVQSIAARVVDGSIKRAEMRRTWEAYRPALAGRTARGTGVEVPTIDLRDSKQFHSVVEAQVFTSLSAADPAWTGIRRPHSFEIFHRIQPEFDKSARERFEFDAVVVTRASKNDPLEFHGIEIRGNGILTASVIALLQKQLPYCNYLWLAIGAQSQEIDDCDLPAQVGLLVAEYNSVRVLRQAQPSIGKRTGDLAKGLLLRTLRR